MSKKLAACASLMSMLAQPALSQQLACPGSGEYLSIYNFSVYDDQNSPLTIISETPKGSSLETTDDVIQSDGHDFTYVYAFINKNSDGSYQTSEGYVLSEEIRAECE